MTRNHVTMLIDLIAHGHHCANTVARPDIRYSDSICEVMAVCCLIYMRMFVCNDIVAYHVLLFLWFRFIDDIFSIGSMVRKN